MKYHKAILLFLLIFSIFSCKDKEIPLQKVEEGIQIRIKNTSPFTYHNTLINTAINDINFGTLAPEASSEYLEVKEAYRYAFVELTIDGKTYTIQPIDYVGETVLTPGKYTYNISASDSEERLNKLGIVLVED
ncbi:MAG: hypothetical protein COB81_09070 [Flavobacteriaceae bacterium]|nr:MAG: hypothetical protein COB81_09070 [Flavobacteriaceae bacterium]